MEKVVEIKVQASGHDLTQHLADVVKAYKQALADGWQPGTDIPVVILSVIGKAPAIMATLPQLGPDAAADKLAFIKGVNIGAYDIVEAALK